MAAHLEREYGISVTSLIELDQGVIRADHVDGSWVARVFPPARPLDAVAGDAAILRALESHGFPAERCAHPDAARRALRP